VRRKFYELVDRITDRLFCAFLILFAIAAIAVLSMAEFLFKKKLEHAMEKHTNPKTGDAKDCYQGFRDRHPILGWLIKWPLRLFAM
jgi:hypothetical protein